MLQVGVAVRLNKLPSELVDEPLENLALVAAYCELEAEEMKKQQPPATGAGSNTKVQTTTYTVKKRK